MTTYDNFAHTFSESRKNMKWEEIEYFLSKYTPFGAVLDVGCGNGRLFGELKSKIYSFENYFGIDSSEKLLKEAIKLHGNYFQTLDMVNISSLRKNSFDSVFLIASFHHLETQEERLQVLRDTKKLLKSGGKIFLTNWALESDFNREKYSSSKVVGSENTFGGSDFQIKIGEFSRYYHSFTLRELENLSQEAGYEIVENRLFETGKNTITILKSL